MAPVAPSYTHVEAHQFQQILIDSNPEGKLMDLINNKGWDGHTVYDRKKRIFTTALYLAVEAENTSVISWLLKWSPNEAEDILEPDSSKGRTALHAAATVKDPEIVSSLLHELTKQAQVNVADNKGNTPLHIAVKEQNVKVIAALLHAGADPCGQKNKEGNAPLHLAVYGDIFGDNLEVLKELLTEHGPNRLANVDTPDSGEETPLHLAVKRMQGLLIYADPRRTPQDHGAVGKDMVVMLIANGADPCQKNKEGESPLHLAALQVKVNESEVFQLLLHTALKAQLKKAESVEDITNALEGVRKQEDVTFTEALKALKCGWNIIDNDVVYGNKTALHLASEIGNETLVKALLKSKPEVRVVNLQDELGNTALHFAASGGHFGIVKLLLGHTSADVNQQNKKGDSPLHSAVGRFVPFGYRSSIEIVTELLKAGAETNKRNELGQTPLHFAVAQYRDDIARKLADQGADFHLKDNTGAGVLHFAARGGGPGIFKLLKDKLKEGLDVNQATTAGLTPLHFAAWNGNWLALKWLLESPEFKGMLKLDVQDNVENGLPWQWAAMGGKLESFQRLIREHVERRIKVFPGSHKEWKRVFQRIEDHNQAHMIDFVPWCYFKLSEESQLGKESLVLEPGILSCAAAYGDSVTNKRLVRVLTNQLNLDQQKNREDSRSALSSCLVSVLTNDMKKSTEDSVEKVVEKSRLMEWAALSSTRDTKFGGKDRFNDVKVVMEFLMKKYPDEKAINNQLRLAFKIAFLNADQCKCEKQGRNTFAKCMAECFTWELPNMIKEAIWKELDINQFKDLKYQTLPSKYKDAFNDISELVEDVPVAYWEAKLEEHRSFKGSKTAPNYEGSKTALNYEAKKTNDDGGDEQRKQLAQRVKQYSKESIKHYPNDMGRRTGRTALHWATIFNEPETVIALSAKDCKPDICDSFGKPPYWYAQSIPELEEETVVMNCLKWSSYNESLHKDRQMFVDGLNAILVGSALIASVTFGGFLSPPLQYNFKFKDRQYVSMDIAGVQVFWVANSLSFFFAMASALAGVTGVLPSPDKFDLRLLIHLRRTLIAAAVMLVLSISFVLVAFGAAGLSALPPLLKYQRNMIYPSVPGTLVCIGPFCTFIYALYNLIKLRSLRSLLSRSLSKAGHGSDGQKKRKEVEDDQECAKMRFGSETLEELLLSPPSGPSPPQRYTRNGQPPWEDGLDSLVQTDGATVRAQQDDQAGASEARTDQEDEGSSGYGSGSGSGSGHGTGSDGYGGKGGSGYGSGSGSGSGSGTGGDGYGGKGGSGYGSGSGTGSGYGSGGHGYDEGDSGHGSGSGTGAGTGYGTGAQGGTGYGSGSGSGSGSGHGAGAQGGTGYGSGSGSGSGSGHGYGDEGGYGGEGGPGYGSGSGSGTYLHIITVETKTLNPI